MTVPKNVVLQIIGPYMDIDIACVLLIVLCENHTCFKIGTNYLK